MKLVVSEVYKSPNPPTPSPISISSVISVRDRLVALRESILSRSKSIHIESLTAERHSDEMDNALALADRERSAREVDRTGRMLREIEAAIKRVDGGEYGVCEECGEGIGEKRLEAVPTARMCVGCQGKREKDG